MPYTKILILLLYIFSYKNVYSQKFQYLKIQFDSTSNLKISKLAWKALNKEYPTKAMTAFNKPSPLLITGDAPSWQIFYFYDNSPQTVYVGHVLNSKNFSKSYTLNLGSGNGIFPDSLIIEKPRWSGLTRFKVLLSTNNKTWETYLDTTLITSNFTKASFPLAKLVDTKKPTSPQNLKASMITSKQVRLDWEKSTDNIAVSRYFIYQNGKLIDSSVNSFYGVQNLKASSKYTYYVTASDLAGNTSTNSNTIAITTHVVDNTKPILKDSLKIIQIKAKSVKLSWQKATDNKGIAGYLLWLNGSFTDVSDTNYYIFSGLKELKDYEIKVYAKDPSGNLSIPIKVSITTPKYNGTMDLGTNFWNQEWSVMSNQLFTNGYQNVNTKNPWKVDLLDELDYAKTLRFMEMQQINRDAKGFWLDRKTKANTNQDEIAYEWMIDLCNRKNANLWICLPTTVIHRGGINKGKENYIRKLALLVKTGIDMGDANLDLPEFEKLYELTAYDLLLLGGKKVCDPLKPQLKIFIEYGNENWNNIFPQSRYVRNEGTAMGLSTNEWASGRLFTAYASLQLFKEFESVFGKNAERIETVLPLHGAELYFLYHSFSNVFDLAKYNPSKIYPDVISGATYFGGKGSINGENPKIDSILRKAMNDNVTAFITQIDSLTSWGKARNTQFRMVSYEGGHHVTRNYDSLNANPLIYNIYTHFLDTMAHYFEEIVLYNHVSTNAFGLKQYVGQPKADAHKYRAVIDWLNRKNKKIAIELFNATIVHNNIELKWATNREENIKGFIIQKSIDGILYDSIGFIASLGNINKLQNYLFTDNNPVKGKNYYRLKLIGMDNSTRLSSIVLVNYILSSLNNKITQSVSIYPNPVKNTMHINLEKQYRNTPLIIIDSKGKLVEKYNNIPPRVNLNNLKSGLYFIQSKMFSVTVIKK